MADRLQVTDLDFDTIKENLKNFLRQQSEFQDYDFDGSGLNVLLDILAYNTHYNAYYLNMVANESFLDTAIMRSSVVSHAKSLGYVPFSRSAAVANVTVTVTTTSEDTTQSLTIPEGFIFGSNIIDNISYNFNVLDSVTATRIGNQFVFENLDIYEGELINRSFNYSSATNSKSLFTLPEENIDTKFLKVYIQRSSSNSSIETYTLATDIFEIDGNSPVYFLQEGKDGKYEIYFGDGKIGKQIPDDCIVRTTYLVTNGESANKANGFIPETTIGFYSNIAVTVNALASGSSERESIESIRRSAPLQYATQNRLVTLKDYESYIKKNYPSVESVSVWGSEDDIPPSYGKVIMSLKPKENFYISELEKQRIIDEIIKPKSIIAIQAEIRDPEYLFIVLNNYVQYDKRKTTDNEIQIENKIRNAILNYRENNLNSFDGKFVLSKLQNAIDATNPVAILGSETIVKLQKRFSPILNATRNYSVNFNLPLKRGTLTNRLISTEFDVADINGVRRTVVLEEGPETYTGIEEIQIVNPGNGFTTEPTVIISGDGLNATARATIINGRLSRIDVTNPGFNYSRATISIVGGGGTGAQASAVITARTGFLRTVYYDINAQKQIVNNQAGKINYETGKIELTDIRVISVNSPDSFIRLTIESENGIIETVRNTILDIDVNDSSAITVDLVETNV